MLTFNTMQIEIEAHLRSIGCGFAPEPLAGEHLAAERVMAKAVQRVAYPAPLGNASRATRTETPHGARGALRRGASRWWLLQPESPATGRALLERHDGAVALQPPQQTIARRTSIRR